MLEWEDQRQGPDGEMGVSDTYIGSTKFLQGGRDM